MNDAIAADRNTALVFERESDVDSTCASFTLTHGRSRMDRTRRHSHDRYQRLILRGFFSSSVRVCSVTC